MKAAARDRAWLTTHLPHQGRMNLLDEVVAWDGETLHARATSHRAADNPLRRGGELPIACGIEYGAQAVAAHGALLAEATQPASAGFLASVRSVQFHAPRLDDVPGVLDVHVEQLARGADGLLYRFRVHSAGRMLLEGRVAIVLDAASNPRGGVA
jgi:predicted hotdog family 3-hydroxylacyl-ACP dehydratase